MSDNSIGGSTIADRIQNGKSPPLRKRRTREYVHSNQKNEEEVLTKRNAVNGEEFMLDELGRNPFLCYPDERERLLEITQNYGGENNHQSVVMENHHDAGTENSQDFQDKHQMVKAENKILRERLQNALQREMKALKTFKKLAKENRQLKNSLRKYERKALGFYDDDTDSDSSDPPIQEPEVGSSRNDTNVSKDISPVTGRYANRRQLPSLPIYESQEVQTKTTDEHEHECRYHSSNKPSAQTEDKSTSTDGLYLSIPETKHLSPENCENPSWVVNNHLDKVIRRTRPHSAQEADSDSRRRKNGLSEEHTRNRYSWNESIVVSSKPGIVNSLQRASSTPCLLDERELPKRSISASNLIEDDPNKFRKTTSESHLLERVRTSLVNNDKRVSYHEEQLDAVPEEIDRGKGLSPKMPIQEIGFRNPYFTRIEDIHDNRRPLSLGSETDSAVSSSKELDSPSHSPPLYDSPRISRSYSPVVFDLIINQDGDENRILSDRSSDSGRPLSPFTGNPRTLKQSNSLPHGFQTQLPHSRGPHEEVFIDNESRENTGTDDKDEFHEGQTRDNRSEEDMLTQGRNRSSTVSDSISLRVEGNISGESPQTLAADIAAFLQYRQKCKSESTQPNSRKTDSDDEDNDDVLEAAMVARYRARSGARRGSAMVTLPDTATLQMDLLTSVGEEDMGEASNLILAKRRALSESENNLATMDLEKRSRWSLLRNRKKVLLKQEREKTEDFKEYLAKLRITSSHKDRDLTMYKDMHWTQLIKKHGRYSSDVAAQIPESERKRRDAVWELFHSEIIYLMDHLLVLKEVFYDALLYLENEGHLMSVEPKKLFANVEDLCEVSEKFAEGLLALLKQDTTRQFGSTEAIVAAFNEFGWTVHPQYQRYCLNYSRALVYLDTLKKQKQFNEYVKCCESDPRCNRLQLTDLLVAPLQHLTKYPLLLKNIRKRTSQRDKQHDSLTTTIKSVEKSIKELEGKVKWLSNYERLQELQSNISWPTVIELDPKAYVPDNLRSVVARQPCESLLASPKRQLLYEGPLILYENTKVDIFAFLFDDMLLLTKTRKPSQKSTKKLSLVGVTTTGTDSPPPTPTTTRKSSAPVGGNLHHGSNFLVHKQPVPVDRFMIYDLDSYAGGSGLKNAFVIVHYSRFKQTLAVYTLQAPSQNLKVAWVSKIKAAQSSWSDTLAQEEAAEKTHVHRLSGTNGSSTTSGEHVSETVTSPSPPPLPHSALPTSSEEQSPPQYHHQRVIESHC